jgi:hypothetical protein
MTKLMKLAAIAAVMALVLAACDHPLPIDEGGGLVTLSISNGADSSRALTADLAKQGSNYLEVIFHHGADYYRVAGYMGDPLRISVPAADYETTAIMMAGRGEDKTLLAVGKLNSIDGSPGTTISLDTTAIGFTLYPLLTNAVTPTSTGNVEFQGKQVPYYPIAANTNESIEYKIELFADSSPIQPLLFWADNLTTLGTITTWGLTDATYTPVVLPMPPLGSGDPVFDTATMPVNTAVTFGSNVFSVKINIPASATPAGTMGWSFLKFRAPIRTFANAGIITTGGNANDTWYVQAGLVNNKANGGVAADPDPGPGGGLVLNVGGANNGFTLGF